MDNQKSLSTRENNHLKYFDSKDTARIWEVALDYKTKVYLTTDEKLFYMSQIADGKTIIQIGDLTLTPKFIYIIPIKEEPKLKLIPEPVYEDGRIVSFKI